MSISNTLTSDEIVEDIDEKDDLSGDRTIGPQDEDDNNPSDTTPAEAEELADEGVEIIKNMRNPGEE